MAKNEIYFLFLLLSILINIHSQLTDKKREKLLKKRAKLIDVANIELLHKKMNPKEERSSNTFKYSKSKIDKIISENNFPKNLDLRNSLNIIVKDQGMCSSCWAFASSTCLSYRFQKKGINVDLSPMDPLSCLNKKCEDGYNAYGTFLYSNKNGTADEKCIPYKATKRNDYTCKTKCEDGSTKKKYYSKNIYYIDAIYDEEHYYDYVTIIMDQLINYGPVYSAIMTYDDFPQTGSNCRDIIYTHNKDKTNSDSGSHAVVIMGYGLKNNKYYWIVQNSWGKYYCDNGFLKIEFGEIGIENVAFAEPNLQI